MWPPNKDENLSNLPRVWTDQYDRAILKPPEMNDDWV